MALLALVAPRLLRPRFPLGLQLVQLPLANAAVLVLVLALDLALDLALLVEGLGGIERGHHPILVVVLVLALALALVPRRGADVPSLALALALDRVRVLGRRIAAEGGHHRALRVVHRHRTMQPTTTTRSSPCR